MGRKSRLKKQYSAQAKKAMRQLIEESSPEPYGKNNGKKRKDSVNTGVTCTKTRRHTRSSQGVQKDIHSCIGSLSFTLAHLLCLLHIIL